jgi:hypothetical protein
MPEDDVHDGRALSADFAPAPPAPMPEEDAVILKFEELLVKFEQLLRAQITLRKQLLLCVSQHLFSMTHGKLFCLSVRSNPALRMQAR